MGNEAKSWIGPLGVAAMVLVLDPPWIIVGALCLSYALGYTMALGRHRP